MKTENYKLFSRLPLILLFCILITAFIPYPHLIAGESFGQLQVTFTDSKHVLKIDGSTLKPDDRMHTSLTLKADEYLFEIYTVDGNGAYEKLGEDYLTIPEGYIVATQLGDGMLTVLESSPLKKSDQPASSSTSYTPRTVNNYSTSASVNMTLTIDHGATTINSNTNPSTTPGTTLQPGTTLDDGNSQIKFVTETGGCEIKLGDKYLVNLATTTEGELSIGTLDKVLPDNYELKITGTELWYEGYLDVGNNEIIEIKIEPGIFEIISRTSR
ncbi:hypothetical protein K8I28_12890 [bacterium]|nr:hypothetical protein [bacterium]